MLTDECQLQGKHSSRMASGDGGGGPTTVCGEMVLLGGEETNDRPISFQSYRHHMSPGATGAEP